MVVEKVLANWLLLDGLGLLLCLLLKFCGNNNWLVLFDFDPLKLLKDNANQVLTVECHLKFLLISLECRLQKVGLLISPFLKHLCYRLLVNVSTARWWLANMLLLVFQKSLFIFLLIIVLSLFKLFNKCSKLYVLVEDSALGLLTVDWYLALLGYLEELEKGVEVVVVVGGKCFLIVVECKLPLIKIIHAALLISGRFPTPN